LKQDKQAMETDGGRFSVSGENRRAPLSLKMMTVGNLETRNSLRKTSATKRKSSHGTASHGISARYALYEASSRSELMKTTCV
jgi:hypothetical protein